MQPFHLAAYNESLGSVTNSDVNAVVDDVIQVRNSHLIFSEPYNLLGMFSMGANSTRARFGNVALQYRGIQHLYPIHKSATVPSRPVVDWKWPSPIAMPLNEEITIEATTDAVGPADDNHLLFLAKPDWQPREPSGEDIGWVRATVVITAGAESAWTGLTAVVFERDLFNGVYAVVGANVVAANAVAFRLDFRTQPAVAGRKHRPGSMVQDVLGDIPWPQAANGLGEWGRFSTFEPPSIQTLDDTAGGTYEVRLRLKYLGPDLALLQR